MSFGGGRKEAPWRQFVEGGAGGMLAVCCTHPLDLLKVRLQIMNSASKGDSSLVRTTVSLFRNEGFFAFYKGLSASLLRQGTYTTTRFGLYLKLKGFFEKDRKSVPLHLKIASSMLAGAGGAFVGSPADVVLVRMQADGKLPPDLRRNYKHAIDGLFQIAKKEGIFALWRGVGPNVNRAMLMTAGQLASYDQTKELILHYKVMKEGFGLHFTASFIAGFVAAVITCPVDVIKTRIMNMKPDTGVVYKNAFDCFGKTLQNEGPFAFYKGFVPYFLRLGPQTILTFIFYEQLANMFDFIGIGKK